MTEESANEYAVDVWFVKQESFVVKADGPKEAKREARDVIETEHWPEEIQEVRVLE